jgi:hypothetical protein
MNPSDSSAGGLPDHLDQVHQHDLGVLVGVERHPALGGANGDPVSGLEDVGQPFVVTPHRATASRSTRSRIRSFSPPGVATWVITPSSSSTPRANPAMSK